MIKKESTDHKNTLEQSYDNKYISTSMASP